MSDDDTSWVVGLLGLGGLGLGAYLWNTRKARAEKTEALPAGYLTKNFQLSEFLRTSNPGLARQLKDYKLSSKELSNLLALTKLLQKGRDRFGVIRVTGGGRPPNLIDDEGRNFEQWLAETGKAPAKNSQHKDFSAADIIVVDPDKRAKAFKFFVAQPESNQVLIYKDNDALGYMHISIRQPDKGGIFNQPVATVVVDGIKKPWSGNSNAIVGSTC